MLQAEVFILPPSIPSRSAAGRTGIEVAFCMAAKEKAVVYRQVLRVPLGRRRLTESPWSRQTCGVHTGLFFTQVVE